MSRSSLHASRLAYERWRRADEEPQLNIRAGRKRARTPLAFKLVLAGGFLALALSAFLPQYLQYRDLQSELQRLEEEKARLMAEQQRLEEERAMVLTDEYVERMAREKLGLVKKGEAQVIRVVPGQPRPLKDGAADPSAFAVH